MSVYELILKRRTIRKFKQQKIERSILEKLVNAARFAPSAANMQPLKYMIVDEKEKADVVFANVKWAGYIAPEGDPKENEKPVAYIIVLVDTDIKKSNYELDAGAAIQNIILTSLEEGIGACWIGSTNRNNLRSFFGIPEKEEINSVIALGYPLESPVAEEEKGSIKYYKDEAGVLHVPKRKLEDIIIK